MLHVVCNPVLRCSKQRTVPPWSFPAAGRAHQWGMEEQAAKATTHGNRNGSDGRDTHAWMKGLGVFSASTPVARTQTTVPHHFGLLFFLIHFSAASKCKEGRGLKRVSCCSTPTCAIGQRHRGQAKLEGAMVRATRQAHSRVARSPGCAVDQTADTGQKGIVHSMQQQQFFCVVIWD